MNKFSFNNRFIVEPYSSDRTIKATQGSGFAMIQQKVALKGLKLLVEVRLFENPFQLHQVDGIKTAIPVSIPAGSIVYIREEVLFNAEWAKKNMECDAIDGKFIIVDRQFIEMIDIK